MHITIDGPAGAGKTTAAAEVARRLGFAHLDTGALYRLVAREALAGGAIEDPSALREIAERVAGGVALEATGVLTFGGEDPAGSIRTPEVGAAASAVAAVPEVRVALLDAQRRLVDGRDVVIEGRDTGSVVFPAAEVKVYLDADERVRASRRAGEAGQADAEATLAALQTRDERDRTREVAPMTPPEGALVIETTDLSAGEVAERIVAAVDAARESASRMPAGREPVLRTTRANRTDLAPANIEADRTYLTVRAILDGLGKVLFRLEVTGRENIPATGPGIIAPNHRSLLDIPVVSTITRRKQWLMGKEELFAKEPMNWAFRRLGGFPVRRGRPDRAALNLSIDLLRRGALLCLYPEGTRTIDASFKEIEDGFAYLALKTGAPIVPVALTGTESVFPRDRKLPKLVKVRVLVGEPFSIGGPIEGIVRRPMIQEAKEQATEQLQSVLRRLEPFGPPVVD